ncbi:MAG TPA: AAA family ATPase, partial [Solirubrobacterales bacterium]|nr:AAA family ATPase [Solirubrobacterales bacterium]
MEGEGQATRIELCGRLAARIEGTWIEAGLRGRQGRELFAYLVVNRGRQVGREELIAALWPAAPPASAGAALSSLLSGLRRALGSDRVRGRSELQLLLPADAWIDLEAATAALERSRSATGNSEWEQAWGPAHAAMAIAERQFLPGHEAPWIDERRRELEELLLDALEAVAAIGLELGGSELSAAERAARRLVELSPYRESGYTVLMELRSRQGNVAEALQVYDRLARLLVAELGTTPGPRARELHQQLLGGHAEGGAGADRGAPAFALPPHLHEGGRPFVGRRDEFERLQERLREVEADRRRTVLLEGEPGIGKTRLAAEFARRAHQRGASVLYGRSFEQAVVSHEPFVMALRRYVLSIDAAALRAQVGRSGGELARLVPELAERLPSLPEPVRGDPDGERFRAFEAVAEFLARASERRPVVLVLDDLHWADE